MNSIPSYQWQDDGICLMSLQLQSDDLAALFLGLEIVGERIARGLPRKPRLGPDEWPEFSDYIEANGAAAEPLRRLQDLMLGIRVAAQEQALDLMSPSVRAA
ncbi:MAG: hypothetical protein AB1651_17080 [Pseudomonadota bacterium]